MAPNRRLKRAAAAAAEGKIREAIQEINSGNEKAAKKQRSLTATEINPPKEDDTITKRLNYDAAHGEDATDFYGVHSRTSSVTTAARDTGNASDLSGLFSTSDDSLQSMLFSGPCRFPSDSSVKPSAAEARQEHQRRRAARQVQSTGPMRLSRGTYYRMSLGSTVSPQYSPLLAARLSFTPATKLPPHSAFLRSTT